MPLEQTVTIVNNSGKIISSGKQLFSLFKEAKGAYQDKRAELQAGRPVQRSQTFDAARSVYRHDDSRRHRHRGHDRRLGGGHAATAAAAAADDDDDDDDSGHDDYARGYGGRRHSHDVSSETGSRRSSRHRRHRHPRPRRDALTETNLQALTEAPSTAAYRAPYAETVPLDVALSRLDVSPAADAVLAPRRRSEPNVAATSRAKDIDMNLAYGNVPPDLADRVDLDPARADLELITPEADRATRERHAKDGSDVDARSQRSGRTHKSSKSHRKLPKEKGSTRRSKSSGGDSPRRSPSDRASVSGGSDARGPRSSRGGSQKSVKAIEGGRGGGGGGSRDDELDVFRPRARHGDNMLKAIFRSKKEKEGGGGGAGASKNELVLA